MNLRTIYGDAVADDIVKRTLIEMEGGYHRIKYTNGGEIRACCIVGAANLIAARIHHQPMSYISDMPSEWKGPEDAAKALGRDELSVQEAEKIEQAIKDWDELEFDREYLTGFIAGLFDQKGA